MTIATAQLIAGVFEAYGAAGLLFALVFLTRPVVRADGRMHRAPLALRLLLLPGVAALWPLFVVRWMKGFPEPVERTPHRTAAAQAGVYAARATAARGRG